MIRAVAEAHPLEQVPRPFPAFGPIDTLEQLWQGHVLEGVQPRHQVERLEDEPNFRPPEPRSFTVPEFADRPAADDDLARRRRVQTAHEVHQRRLAGTARSHDRGVRSPRHREGDAVERVNGFTDPIGLADVLEGYRRLPCHAGSSTDGSKKVRRNSVVRTRSGSAVVGAYRAASVRSAATSRRRRLLLPASVPFPSRRPER